MNKGEGNKSLHTKITILSEILIHSSALSAPASSTTKSTDDEEQHRGRHCVLTPGLRNRTFLEQEGRQPLRSQLPSGFCPSRNFVTDFAGFLA